MMNEIAGEHSGPPASAGPVEREMALVRAGNMLAISSLLVSEYRQLVSEYGARTGQGTGTYDGRTLSRFSGTVASLYRPQNWRDMPDAAEAKSAIADGAEAKFLRALGILRSVERESLGDSSLLSPEDKARIAEEVQTLRYGIHGLPKRGQIELPFWIDR
jgi:hypothetical protein